MNQCLSTIANWTQTLNISGCMATSKVCKFNSVMQQTPPNCVVNQVPHRTNPSVPTKTTYPNIRKFANGSSKSDTPEQKGNAIPTPRPSKSQPTQISPPQIKWAIGPMNNCMEPPKLS